MTSISYDPYLYIIMRSGLDSLNPGKACAQASHAANQMVFDARLSYEPALGEQLAEWENASGFGFGPCVVLSADYPTLTALVRNASAVGHHAAMVHDPSYPLRDGATTHHLPLDTCAYLFGPKGQLARFVKDLPLMA